MERKQTSKTSKSKENKKKLSKPAPVKQEEVDENNEEPLEVRFEREVAWCKAEIFKRLHHVELDSKKGFDLARALKILESDKAEMIKKRQAMRTTLGDYRKQMKEEEKKQAAAAKKMSLKPADESQAKLSTCFKMSATQQKTTEKTPANQVDAKLSELSLAESNSQPHSDTHPLDTDKKKDDSQSFKFEKTDNDFKFGFTQSTENSPST